MCGRDVKKCVACENETYKQTPQGNSLCKEHWDKFVEMVLESKPPTEAHGLNPDEYQSIEDINARARTESWYRNRHGYPPPARRWSVEDSGSEAGYFSSKEQRSEQWDRTPMPDHRSRR